MRRYRMNKLRPLPRGLRMSGEDVGMLAREGLYPLPSWPQVGDAALDFLAEHGLADEFREWWHDVLAGRREREDEARYERNWRRR